MYDIRVMIDGHIVYGYKSERIPAVGEEMSLMEVTGENVEVVEKVVVEQVSSGIAMMRNKEDDKGYFDERITLHTRRLK